MTNKRLPRLDRIAKKLGRFHIWSSEQRMALTDNIDSELEMLKRAILSLKI